MKNLFFPLVLGIFIQTSSSYALGPEAKKFGFGIILGEPTGLTGKYWLNPQNALEFNIGSSYFGRPRIDFDYLWHFNAFSSNILKLFAGPGAVIGFGEGNGYWYEWRGDRFFYRTHNEIGLAAAGLFGLNIIPEKTPLEIFLEAGILVGVAPGFGSSADFAIGLRFYP